MALGGVPYYLEQVRKGENSTTAIERICFSPDGTLRNEYDNLYKALFKNPEYHEALIEILAKTPEGLTQKQIIEKTDIPQGGTFNRTRDDLLLSGFIEERTPYGKKKRETIYKLIDEYSIFYHRFMKHNRKYTKGMWNQLAATQAYKIWLGYAFETFCARHIDHIKQALGIAAVYTEIYSLRVKRAKDKKGFQIDLIIDRADNTINLCEMKFYGSTFKIDKSYGLTLANRKQAFIDTTKTKKQIFTTMITSFGLEDNQYALAFTDASLQLDDIIQ